MAGTRFNQAITIGAPVTSLAALGATIMMLVYGGLNVKDAVNFVPNGVSTGATLQLNGVVERQFQKVRCTTTGTSAGTVSGSLANYDFCYVRSPFSTTGALLAFGLDCGSVPRPFTMSGGFVRTRSTSLTTRGFPVASGRAVNSGTIAAFRPYNVLNGSGGVAWHPSDILKIQAISASWNTGNDCSMWYEARDAYGS